MAKALKSAERHLLIALAGMKRGGTQEQIAKKLGWKKVKVENTIALLDRRGEFDALLKWQPGAVYVVTERGAELVANMNAAVREAALPGGKR